MHREDTETAQSDTNVLIEVMTAPMQTSGRATPIGYRLIGTVDDDEAAPALLIAGIGETVERVLEFLTEMPGFSGLKGSLYLLKLEALDSVHTGKQALFPSVQRFDDILFLPEVTDGNSAHDMTRKACWTALRFCLRGGAFGQNAPRAPYLH